MTSPTDRRDRSDSAIWQEVEFGSYEADLALWTELADAAGGPALELGAGAGRVSLRLARRGVETIALEGDAELSAELERAAEELDAPLTVVSADLTDPAELELPGEPGLVIGPLHVIQVLDAEARQGLLDRLAELAAPGAILALTVVDESTLLSSGAAANTTGGHKHHRRILPDMRELDGWVYSSEPLWVQVGDEILTVRRLRERVSPEGQMERRVHDEVLHRLPPERLEEEAAGSGLRQVGRRQISSGANEADSIVVLLEVPA
jgi:precorrin-6B methylase 2